jgi:hypothetical protein
LARIPAGKLTPKPTQEEGVLLLDLFQQAVMKIQSPEKSALRDGTPGNYEKWYSLVDSLRTSLAQSCQNLEIDLEEVGALACLAE